MRSTLNSATAYPGSPKHFSGLRRPPNTNDTKSTTDDIIAISKELMVVGASRTSGANNVRQHCLRCLAATKSLSYKVTTFIAVVTAMTFAASGAAPTMFYQRYQETFGLTPFILTIIFGAYGLSLLGALLTVSARCRTISAAARRSSRRCRSTSPPWSCSSRRILQRC
jgi:hypothetical protein